MSYSIKKKKYNRKRISNFAITSLNSLFLWQKQATFFHVGGACVSKFATICYL